MRSEGFSRRRGNKFANHNLLIVCSRRMLSTGQGFTFAARWSDQQVSKLQQSRSGCRPVGALAGPSFDAHIQRPPTRRLVLCERQARLDKWFLFIWSCQALDYPPLRTLNQPTPAQCQRSTFVKLAWARSRRCLNLESAFSGQQWGCVGAACSSSHLLVLLLLRPLFVFASWAMSHGRVRENI